MARTPGTLPALSPATPQAHEAASLKLSTTAQRFSDSPSQAWPTGPRALRQFPITDSLRLDLKGCLAWSGVNLLRLHGVYAFLKAKLFSSKQQSLWRAHLSITPPASSPPSMSGFYCSCCPPPSLYTWVSGAWKPCWGPNPQWKSGLAKGSAS